MDSGLRPTTTRQICTWLVRVWLWLWTLGDLWDAQVFYADEIETPCQVRAGLFDPVLTAAPRVRVDLCDCSPDLLAPPGATPAPCQSSLQVLASFLQGLRHGGARQQFTGRQRCRHGYTAIDSDYRSRARPRNRRWDNGKGNVPMTCAVAGDPVRLRGGKRTGQPKPHPADLRYVRRGPFPAELCYPRRLRTDDAEARTAPGFPPCRSPVSASEEKLNGLVEISQRLLLYRLRPGAQPSELCASLGQLSTLLRKAWYRTLVTSPHGPLLEGKIPDKPSMSAVREQSRSLLCGRVKPEAGHICYPSRQHRQFSVSEGRQSRHVLVPADQGNLRRLK